MVSTGRGLCLGVLLRAYIIWMMTIKAMGCMVLYIIDGSLLMHQEVSIVPYCIHHSIKCGLDLNQIFRFPIQLCIHNPNKGNVVIVLSNIISLYQTSR
jgi:hypothetical protein